MALMQHPHKALGRAVDTLDVVVIDDHKPMQSILRSILGTARVRRVRAFDAAGEALRAMALDPPDIAIVDWRMKPVDGMELVKAMRRTDSGPLALVPVILATASPTRRLVARAVRAGIHAVLVKPISPATLLTRINAILADKRRFVHDPATESWRLEDAEALLAAQGWRPDLQTRVEDDEASVLTLPMPKRAPRRRNPAVPYAPNPVEGPIPLDAYRPVAPEAAPSPDTTAPAAAAAPTPERRVRPARAEAPLARAAVQGEPIPVAFAAVRRAPREGATGQRRREAP